MSNLHYWRHKLSQLKSLKSSVADSATYPSTIEEPGEEAIVQQRDTNIATMADVSLVDLAESRDQFFTHIQQLWNGLIIAAQSEIYSKDENFILTLPIEPRRMLFTTRAVERDFGLLKMLLERNRDTRTILLFAQLHKKCFCR